MSRIRESHGRTFHNTDSNYSLPSDDEEYRRLNIQHESLKLVAGSNYIVPLRDIPNGPKAILDLCCGSGQWVLEMAEEFPMAQIVGIDIVIPTLPKDVPRNCTFLEGDATQTLPFGDASFDFVQMRVTPSLFARMAILREIGRILREGGFVTFEEPDELYSQTLGGHSPAMKKMDGMIIRLPHSAPPTAKSEDEEYDLPPKKSWSIASIIVDMIKMVKDSKGRIIFQDVDEKMLKMPIGPWPIEPNLKRAGELQAENQLLLLDGFRPPMLDHEVMTEDEFSELRKAVAAEVYDTRLEIVSHFHWAWGRKRHGLQL